MTVILHIPSSWPCFAKYLSSYVSPCTIQDPTYVNFEEGMMQLCLDDPHFSLDDGNFSDAKLCWQWQCLLSSLTSVIKDNGKAEMSVCFKMFKHNLLSMRASIAGTYDRADEKFFQNFIMSTMIHCIYHGMKEVTQELRRLQKDIPEFRPIFPQALYTC